MKRPRRNVLKILTVLLTMCLMLYVVISIGGKAIAGKKTAFMKDWASHYTEHVSDAGALRSEEFGKRLSEAAFKLTKAHVRYDGSAPAF